MQSCAPVQKCPDSVPLVSSLTPEALSQNAANEEISQEILDKREWVKMMRLKFSKRAEFPITNGIITPNGLLNQEYFRPSRSLICSAAEEDSLKWTETENALLIQGIEKYGIGNYRMVSDEFLPKWGPNELRLKTMRLVGRQNLQEYKFWKGTKEDIEKEYKWNKELGLKLNCWKSGVLVYDDDGKVAGAIAERNIATQKLNPECTKSKRRRI